MGEIDHGGQAFPTEGGTDSGLYPDPGMSLRDYFAGQALAGYFAFTHAQHQNAANSETAEYCYRMADAMIAARKTSTGCIA